jgi:hypothetical protein
MRECSIHRVTMVRSSMLVPGRAGRDPKRYSFFKCPVKGCKMKRADKWQKRKMTGNAHHDATNVRLFGNSLPRLRDLRACATHAELRRQFAIALDLIAPGTTAKTAYLAITSTHTLRDREHASQTFSNQRDSKQKRKD